MRKTTLSILSTVILAASGLLLCSLFTGCGPATEKPSDRGMPPEDETEQLFTRISAAIVNGKPEEAMALTEKGLTDPKYADQKRRFQEMKIRLLLDAGRSDLVMETVDAAWTSDPEFAPSAMKMLAQHYVSRKEYPALLAWCRRLTAQGSPASPEGRENAYFYILEAVIALRQEADFQTTIRTLLTSADHPPLSRLEASLTPPLNEKETAGFVMKQIDALLPGVVDKDTRDLFLRLNLRGALTLKNWPVVGKTFDACISALSDERLLAASRQVYAAFKAASQTGLIETASQTVFMRVPEKPRSVALAAHQWVAYGMNANSNALPERLAVLMNAKVDPNQIGDLLDRYFYRNVDDPGLMRALCGIGRQLLPLCTDPDIVNTIKLRMLDGAFITENYAAVIEMLEKGIPGKDRAWHALSLPKVKAHLALQQNKPREAVAHFREFMKRLKSMQQEDEYDPTTGITYSKEWLLGRNAARIAKILESIDDRAGANQARSEAEAYFKTALEKTRDPAAVKALKKEAAPYGL